MSFFWRESAPQNKGLRKVVKKAVNTDPKTAQDLPGITDQLTAEVKGLADFGSFDVHKKMESIVKTEVPARRMRAQIVEKHTNDLQKEAKPQAQGTTVEFTWGRFGAALILLVVVLGLAIATAYIPNDTVKALSPDLTGAFVTLLGGTIGMVVGGKPAKA